MGVTKTAKMSLAKGGIQKAKLFKSNTSNRHKNSTELVTVKNANDLKFEGCVFFRERLVLSTLSGRPVTISNIRHNWDEPGVTDYEVSFIRLMDTVTDGTQIVVNCSGTVVKYNPGLLIGGKVEHECSNQRSISYYLEALLCLAPFCKKPMDVTLKGITNDGVDLTVDAIKQSCLPILKRFIIRDDFDIKIVSRGLAPGGGGEVIFHCPVCPLLKSVQLMEAGKVKRVRGIAYAVRVSPAMATRMVDTAKGMLLKFLPDVYIYTDNPKGVHSGKSPGFGISLVAETTTGTFFCGEAISRPTGATDGLCVPEDVAEKAVKNLLDQIDWGGCADTHSQSLACLFLALGDRNVSKFQTGPLSSYTMEFLRNIYDFLHVKMKLDTVESGDSSGSHEVLVTCVGIGYNNLSRTTT